MAQRVFIDIGAHDGATARAVFAAPFAFDRVISAEPDPAMVAHLSGQFADRIAAGTYAVAPVALAESRGRMTLYGDNRGGGASLLAAKAQQGEARGVEVETLGWDDFLSAWDLRGAELYVKINCEGGEIGILRSIIAHDRGEIRSLVVDYDIIKTPWGGWKKWASMRALRRAGLAYELSEEVFVKRGRRPHIVNWLSALPEFQDPPAPRDPLNRMQVARVRWLELVSALGIRHDLFKMRRRRA
ncbi:FkbM family methyltransferase [Rhodovulum sp. DZ06]|uniref:FkbM family methyltransferase n=1 Tax=Rhodovulum sp. DZ06 TaxID=3425126 RepID=UPI003D3548B0